MARRRVPSSRSIPRSVSRCPHHWVPRPAASPRAGDPVHDREGGLGLVEVLVATVVHAVGLLGVAALAGLVARQAARATASTEQILAAQQALERMLEPGADPPAGGDTIARIDGREYRVGRTVLPLLDGGREVTVVVEGRVGARPETLRARIGPRPAPMVRVWP